MTSDERISLDHTLSKFRDAWPREPSICGVPITELEREDLVATLRYFFWWYGHGKFSTPSQKRAFLETEAQAKEGGVVVARVVSTGTTGNTIGPVENNAGASSRS